METEQKSSSSLSSSMDPTSKRGMEGAETDTNGLCRNKVNTADSLNQENEQDKIQPLVQEASINDLPPEMLTIILENVDTQSLFDLHVEKSQWDEICSRLLRNRPDFQLQFDFDDVQGFLNQDKRTLVDFVQKFKTVENCPFGSFFINVKSNPGNASNPSTFFEHADWIEFLTHFGGSHNKIKCLKLSIVGFKFSKIDYLLFLEKLRDLLRDKIPHLQEFCLSFFSDYYDFQQEELSSEDKLFPNQSGIKLPQLKIVHVEHRLFYTHPEIMQDLLRAAPNLKRVISCAKIIHLYPEMFHFLVSIGKLHCLKTARIDLTAEFLSKINANTKQQKQSLPKFELEEFTLKTEEMFKAPCPRIFQDATNFLSNLLESSRKSLNVLKVQRLEFLEGLGLPTFENLTNLSFIKTFDGPFEDKSQMTRQFFPPGVRSLEVFPAVNFLDLDAICDLGEAFPREDSIPRFTLVDTIKMSELKIEQNTIATLGLLCPNLRNFHILPINYRVYSSMKKPNRLEFVNLREIWTHMKQLKSLEISVKMDVHQNEFPALDSAVTGISIENCHRLDKVKKAEQTLQQFGVDVTDVETQLKQLFSEVQRENPSILDLKELKEFIFGSALIDRWPIRNDDIRTLTWISKELAFKLMPHLQVTEQVTPRNDYDV